MTEFYVLDTDYPGKSLDQKLHPDPDCKYLTRSENEVVEASEVQQDHLDVCNFCSGNSDADSPHQRSLRQAAKEEL